MEARLDWEGATISVGASIGVADMLPTTRDFAQWLGEADAACYQAKAAERGVVRASDGTALQPVP